MAKVKYPSRQFTCTSDRSEYVELVSAGGGISGWFLKPNQGTDAKKRSAFELLDFSVNGKSRKIRRSTGKTGQTYTVAMDEDDLRGDEPSKVIYTYRTITSKNSHVLFFDIEQPTKDFQAEFDYTNTEIASVSTLDLVPSARRPKIEHSPTGSGTRTVRLHTQGWMFPRSGVAFVWALKQADAPVVSMPGVIGR